MSWICGEGDQARLKIAFEAGRTNDPTLLSNYAIWHKHGVKGGYGFERQMEQSFKNGQAARAAQSHGGGASAGMNVQVNVVMPAAAGMS